MVMGENNTSQHNPNNETKCISLSSSSAILQIKLKNLKKEYKFFAKSSSKTMENHKKCNSSFEHVLKFDTSPRSLMSALQVQHPTTTTRRRRSLSMSYCSPSIVTQSSGQVWRVRENELAKEEIRRERKLAFESGKLIGRRLFEDESELSFENDDDDVCDEKIVEVEEVVKKVNEENNNKQIKMIKLGDDDDDVKKCRLAYAYGYGKKKKKKMFIIIIIILALMVLVIGIGIILLGGFDIDGYGSDLKVVIAPT